jgi:glucose-1-phosphate cytidylyltransferase
MKVVILAGGLGTRLAEETELKPKPMVEIGGLPILWHIMNVYASAGYREFIIALGYRGTVIKQYFLNYYHTNHDLTVDLKNGNLKVHERRGEDWTVHCVDTGLNTGTGGRLKMLKSWIGKDPFLMTYGDGISNVNISELVKFHKRQKKLATVTAVRPPARFGGIEIGKGLVKRFIEKPQIGEGWINGGFFVFEPEVLDYIDDKKTMLEREPLERLVEDHQLAAFEHDDFWQCMDTMRDVKLLEQLWQSGKAPWKVW